MTRSNLKEVSSLSEHLLELRSRLIKITVVIVLLVACLSFFLSHLLHWIAYPLLRTLPPGSHLSITGVLEGVIIPLKVLLAGAFILSLPFTLYQVWAFVAPGLYRKEKYLILPCVFFSLVLFMLGMAFCYFVCFPLLFKIASTFTPSDIAFYIPTLSNYVSFLITMFLVFGLAFQLPIFMVVLNSLAVFSLENYRKFRSYAIVADFAVAAIVTPPDVISQLLLAIPLIVLYEIGLAACSIRSKCMGRTQTQ